MCLLERRVANGEIVPLDLTCRVNLNAQGRAWLRRRRNTPARLPAGGFELTELSLVFDTELLPDPGQKTTARTEGIKVYGNGTQKLSA